MPERSTKPVDPRRWNLVVGTALLAGCSARAVAGDAAQQTSTDTESSTDAAEPGDTETGSEPECQTHADCEYNYVCHDGYCEPQPGDGCIDFYCGPFEICDYNELHCMAVGEPPPACEDGLASIPTSVDPAASPLAIRFVDVDADGKDELVVATHAELLVYEAGSDRPTVTELAAPFSWIRAMVAGQFDDQPGEDLILLVELNPGPEQHVYTSDGASGFVNASVAPSPVQGPRNLFAGDFDGQPPDDLLLMGDEGARLYFGDGSILVITHDVTDHAAAFEHGSPDASLLLAPGLRLFELTGSPLAEGSHWGDSMAAISSPDQGRYASVRQHEYGPDSWIDVRLWNPADLADQGAILLPGLYTFDTGESVLGAGDFDGDQHDELVACGTPTIFVFDPLGAPCTVTVELDLQGLADEFDVGDHDGDGDDELALRVANSIVILDGE